MRHWLAFLLVLLITSPAFAQVKSLDIAFDNGAGRQVPITITAKPGRARAVILFSHGAFSSPAKYSEISTRWAKAGYAVIAPLHADSSDWRGAKPEFNDQLPWRLADMKLAYARMTVLADKAGVRIAKAPIHAAGHSFGALVAMMDEDPRVRSVIAFSPPGPFPGVRLPVVTKPMLTITGTTDILPGFADRWEVHLAAHQQAKSITIAYIGEGADHYYGGIFGRPERSGPKNWRAFEEAMTLSLRLLKKPEDAPKFKPEAGKLVARR